MKQDTNQTYLPGDEVETDEKMVQYVTFVVGERSFGVDINRVREIRQWSPVTILPNQPAYTRGVFNLRGTIVPVQDLRARFDGVLTEPDDIHVVVIVWIGTKTIGILVDAVSDIIHVPEAEVRPAPVTSAEAAIAGIVNLDDTMIAILELEGLFPAGSDPNAA